MGFFQNETVQIVIAFLIPWIFVAIFSYGAQDNIYPWYNQIKKPTWGPPDWIIGPAWTILYLSMGYASFRVWDSGNGFSGIAKIPLIFYLVHLLVNSTYTQVFLRLHLLGAAAIHLFILTLLVYATGILFYRVDSLAGYLIIPYAVWTSFASVLSYNIWRMNTKSI
jgi:tryptophan-rich sensory protein